MKNFVFISPNFPTHFSRFCRELKNNGLRVLGIGDQPYDELLPEEKREKLASFIRDYQEQHSNQETKRLNRFFDELAGNKEFYEQLKDALFDAFPEARSDSRTTMKWVKNYLYKQLKPTAKLEILPINENVCARYVPAVLLEKREYWVNRVLDINQDVIDGKDEINLYVSLGSNSTVDDHLVMNILNILVSTPGSNVHLRKNIKVYESSGNLAGSIEDNTAIFRTTDLVAAAHAFLNYSKTDLLVDFWENCGEHSDRISSLIYAARHVDVGISMCNIKEVQAGIQRLRNLLRDTRSWTKDGYYVINHDTTFQRVAGVNKAPQDMTLSEIRELRIKDTTGGGAELPVVTLEEMLTVIHGKEKLYIELKGSTADHRMVDDLVRMIRTADCADECVFISLNYDVIDYAETHYPEFETGTLFFVGLGDVSKLNCDLLIMEESSATDHRIRQIHDAGKQAIVWTVNSEAGMRHFLDSEIDAVITDEIPLAQRVQAELDQRTEFRVLQDKLSGLFQ